MKKATIRIPFTDYGLVIKYEYNGDIEKDAKQVIAMLIGTFAILISVGIIFN